MTIPPDLNPITVEQTYQELQQFPQDSKSFGPFLEAWSQVATWIRQGESYAYWNRNRDVTDQSALEAFTEFYGPISEIAQRGEAELRRRALQLEPAQPPIGWQQIRRTFEANERAMAPLSAGLLERQATLVSTFVNEWHSIRVDFVGENHSVTELDRVMQNPDRDLRERAWKALDAVLETHHQRFAALYLELLEVRTKIAQESGNANFVEHHWWTRNRSDYAPQDCVAFADAVAVHFGPLLERFQAEKCKRLGLETLKPWDFRFEPGNTMPEISVQRAMQSITQVLHDLHPSLAGVLTRIRQDAPGETSFVRQAVASGRQVIRLNAQERFDLEARAEKSGASFADYWIDAGHPVLMMTFSGTADDLGLLVHELGHALHYTLAAESQIYYWTLPNSLEFMEFNSHFLELLLLDSLGKQGLIFDAVGLKLARQNQARLILLHLINVCRADRFQHWVYTAQAHDLEVNQIGSVYAQIAQSFPNGADWSEAQSALNRSWLNEVLCTQPLYDIEYAFAWVGGLLLLEKYLWSDMSRMDGGTESAVETSRAESSDAVIRNWIDAMRAGNTLSTGELFRRLGLSFPMAVDDVARAARFFEQLFGEFL